MPAVAKAADFTLPVRVTERLLKDYQGKNNVVLAFYPWISPAAESATQRLRKDKKEFDARSSGLASGSF